MKIPDLIIGFDDLETGETKEYRVPGGWFIGGLIVLWLVLWFLTVGVVYTLDTWF